jgi:hypothetical protein
MMTDLILPKSGNPTLDLNLKAFFQRYPWERARLETLLSVPVPNRADVRVEIPATPSKPPIRVMLLAGIGSPQFMADLFNDKTVQKECFQAFAIENNIDFLRWIFQHVNISQMLLYPKIEWCLMMNEETLKPSLYRILKRENIAAMMSNVHILQTNVPQPEAISAFYEKVPEIYNETVFHVYHNFGRIDDSLDGIRATLMNEKAILNYPGITELKGAFKGMPALIVGAGPSLDKAIPTIKRHNNKFVVLCADAALKPLINAGIRVDYVTSIERLNDYQKPFFEGLEPLTTELVAFPVIQPSQFDIYPGPCRLVYRNYSWFSYFEKNWPKGILKCGGSTSHLAIRLADYFGCNRIYLVGIDSTYENKEGTNLYRSHCSGTGHAEWGDFIPLEDFHKTRLHQPAMEGINNLNEKSVTNITYYQWVKEYAEELAELGHRMTIVNCSPQGLKIEGIPYRDLETVSNSLDEIAIQKPDRKPVFYNRHFKHKEVLQNLKGWQSILVKTIEEANNMLKEEIIHPARFDGLLFVYNFKIVVDPLFVAFVVQCCAKEFFELENKWAYLDFNNWEVERKEKTEITRQKLVLFLQVINKVVKIFEEAKSEQIHQQANN